MEQRVVTILGGAGFLGTYVTRRLASAGYRIRVISRNANKASHLYSCGNVGQIHVISSDINSPESYSDILQGSHAVINLVGILFESGKQKFTKIHSIAAEKLAIAAKNAGVKRLIHISALGVDHEYGSGYARSKILGELAVLSAFPDTTVLRPSVIFGAEDNFFNKFAKMANISPFLPLIGGGKTLFQPVYVDDVARAIEKCLAEPNTQGETYELGGSKIYSFKQILEYIMEVTNQKRILMPLPFSVASFIAAFFEYMPNPPLTRDQVKLLKYNNTVNDSAKKFEHLSISPTSVEMIVPKYLSIYNKNINKNDYAIC
ncbi:MAG: complex I NDUFA9 subunit family protein [Rickettsiales bacterium]